MKVKQLHIKTATAPDGRVFRRGADGGFSAQSTHAANAANQIGFQDFQAAKRVGWKGLFFVPQFAPMRRLTPLTRAKVAQSAQWLYDNVGMAGAIVDRLAVYEAGTGMWPKATTSNPAFNTAVTEIFHQGVKDPRFFDLAKQDSYYSAQVNIRRHIRLHGDHFGQLVRGAVPRVRFIPGYCVDNARTLLDQSLWKQGVMSDGFCAPMQYRVLTNEDGTTWEDVAADDMLHFHDHFLTGQTRGLSIFHRLAEKLFTIDDIVRAESNGALMRARIAYALTTPADGGGGGGPVLQVPGTEGAETVTNADGTTFTIQKMRLDGGETMDVPELPAGYDIKMLESQRPGPNLMAFMDALREDVAWGTGYSPEFINFIARTGGAVVRFITEDTQAVINDKRQNQIEPQFAHRFYIFQLWQRIKSGAFDSLPGGVPADWHRYRMVYPKLMTVDKGREGALDDKRFETGKMSPEEYHGQLGQDAEDVEDEVIRAAVRRRQKVAAAADAAGLAMTYDDVYPPPVGSGNIATPAPDPTDPTEPPDPSEPTNLKSK